MLFTTRNKKSNQPSTAKTEGKKYKNSDDLEKVFYCSINPST